MVVPFRTNPMGILVASVRAQRLDDGLCGQPQLERRELEVLHGLAVLRQLQLTCDHPCLLQLVEVHIEQRPGHPEPAGQLADVHPAARQLGDHPEAPLGGRGASSLTGPRPPASSATTRRRCGWDAAASTASSSSLVRVAPNVVPCTFTCQKKLTYEACRVSS